MSALIFYILAFFISFLIILWNIQKYFSVWRYIDKFPGPKAYPIIGNFKLGYFTLKDFINQHLEWWNSYGCDKYRAYMFHIPYVFISDPKDIETVLTSTKLIDKGDFYEKIRPWLGDGLLTSTGLKWQKHRKMITPSFHFKILNEFLETMDKCAIKFLETLTKLAENGKPFDVQRMTSNYTLDVICDCAFGISLDSESISSDVINSVFKLCEIIPQRPYSAIKKFDFLYQFTSDYRKQNEALKILKDFTSEIIEKRRRFINENENEVKVENGFLDLFVNIKQKKAFLDNLLTAKIDGRALTFQEIFEEVSTFMFEGHDTTKSAINFALYVMSRYHEIQNKILEEQKNIFGSDMTRSATYNELQEMDYLELVIKETLRIFPSVPIIARRTRQYFKLDDHYIIPPHTTVILFLLVMGQNKKYFKDPFTFNPQRFSVSNREKENPFDNVPFSAGPRNCIGQKFAMLEIKTILSKIVRKFEILPPYEFCCNETSHDHDVFDKRLDPPVLIPAMTLKSENGIKLRLKIREII